MGPERESVESFNAEHLNKQHEEDVDGILYMCVNCSSKYECKSQFVNHVRKCGRTMNLHEGTKKRNTLTKKGVTSRRKIKTRIHNYRRKQKHQSGSSKNRPFQGLQIKKGKNSISGPVRKENNNSIQKDTVTDIINDPGTASDGDRINNNTPAVVHKRSSSESFLLQLQLCSKKRVFVSLGERVTKCEMCHKYFTGTKPFQRHKQSCNEMYDPTYHSSIGRNFTVTKNNGRQNALDIEMKDSNISETEKDGHSNELSGINPVIRMAFCDNISKSVKRRNHDCSKSAFTESVEVQKTMSNDAKCVNDYQEVNKVELSFEYGKFHEPFVTYSNSGEVDIINGIENSCHEYILKEGEINATRSDNLKQHVTKHAYTEGQNLTCNEKEKKAYFEEESEGNSVGNSGANIVGKIEANIIEESKANIADTDERHIESELIIIGVRETCIIEERVASNTGDVGSDNAGENESNISEKSETNIIGKGEADTAEESESNCTGEIEANIANEHRDNTVEQTCEISKRQTIMSKRNADNRCKEGGRQDVSKYKNATTSDINQSSYGDTDNESKDTPESDTDNYNSDESWKQSSCDDTDNESDQSSKSSTDFRTSDGSRDRRRRASCTENRKHKCNICDFKSKRPTDLTRHMRIHTGEKPFECGTCNKNFTRSESLRHHVAKRTCVCKGNPIQSPVLNKDKKAISYASATLTKSYKTVVAAIEANIGREMQASFVAESEANITEEGEANIANITERIEANIVGEIETNSVGRRKEKLKGECEANIRRKSKENNYECTSDNQPSCNDTNYETDINITSSDTYTRNEDKSQDCRNFASSTPGGIRKYECSICHYRFAFPSHMTRHMQVHNAEKPFECSICHYRFPLSSHLTRHMRVHNTDKPFECSICHKTFTELYSLKRHAKRNCLNKIKPDPKPIAGIIPFICELCQRSFPNLFRLKEHIKNKTCVNNDKNEKSVKRNESSTSDSEVEKESLMSTENIPGCYMVHYTNVDKSFECNHCHKTFNCKKVIKQHINAQIDNVRHGKVSFLCQICNTEFDMKCKWAYHRAIEHAGNKFKCTEKDKTGSECGKLFTSQNKYRDHRYSVHSKTDILCDICGKTFYKKWFLNQHMMSHISNASSKKKKYMCEVCPKQFSKQDSLKVHSRTHTKETPYKCSKCDMKFGQCSSMKRHEVTHTSEKKFACKLCEKSFTQSQSLTRHMITHTGKTPYRCEPCGLDFREGYRLKLHREKMHSLVSQS